MSRVTKHWLPKFRSSNVTAPIILAGNKIDTRGGVADPYASQKMEAFIKPIMDDFREVDVCVECSAKNMSNISEVFFFAQKAVLYPTNAIYDVEARELKPLADSALRRIFKLCDKDTDGGLNDTELNDFQYHCFGVHLKPVELEGVKKVVRDASFIRGLNNDGSLSAEGFVYLHKLFVQKGRLETTWIVLRKFGYEDDMRLKIPSNQHLNPADDQTIELSESGKRFIGDLFAKADVDTDGLLSPSELNTLFGGCPDPPFASKDGKKSNRFVRDSAGNKKGNYMSLDAYYSMWALFTSDTPEDSMLSLMYLGYPNPVSSAFKITKSRKRDRYARSVSREVITVVVVGSDGILKTNIVRGLVDRPPMPRDSPGVDAVGEFGIAESGSKQVIMKHVPEESMSTLLSSKSALERIDVMCICFDIGDEESYDKARMIWEIIESKKAVVKVPAIFVADVQDDSDAENSLVLHRSDVFCEEKGIPTPIRISTGSGEFGSLYEDVLGVALYPQVACPSYYDGRGDGVSKSMTAVKLIGGAIVLGTAAYGIKCAYDYYISDKSS